MEIGSRVLVQVEDVRLGGVTTLEVVPTTVGNAGFVGWKEYWPA